MINEHLSGTVPVFLSYGCRVNMKRTTDIRTRQHSEPGGATFEGVSGNDGVGTRIPLKLVKGAAAPQTPRSPVALRRGRARRKTKEKKK